MARVRQARRCRAKRTDGSPCGNYAMIAQDVCRSHGGSSPQALQAAYVREFERRAYAEFARVYARWRRELRAWHVQRILTTARLLGIDPREVTSAEIVWCHIEYGRPPVVGDPSEPKMRRDRRFRLPQPPTSTSVDRRSS